MNVWGAVETESLDGVQVVHISGEIDISNEKAVNARVMEAASAAPGPMLIDLSGTRYLDSAGVRILFDVAAHFRAAQRLLKVIAPESATIRRVLTITRFDEHVPIYNSLAEALATL